MSIFSKLPILTFLLTPHMNIGLDDIDISAAFIDTMLSIGESEDCSCAVFVILGIAFLL
jgi:hypothetical protein